MADASNRARRPQHTRPACRSRTALAWWAVSKSRRQGRQEYAGAGRPATNRQLDYIESLLDSAEMTLNEAARAALGRSVRMDSLLSIDEASVLIDTVSANDALQSVASIV